LTCGIQRHDPTRLALKNFALCVVADERRNLLVFLAAGYKFYSMTLQEIKEALQKMPEEQQDHLAAYLLHLRHLRDPGARQELTRRIADRGSSHWVSLDQLKEHWKE